MENIYESLEAIRKDIERLRNENAVLSERLKFLENNTPVNDWLSKNEAMQLMKIKSPITFKRLWVKGHPIKRYYNKRTGRYVFAKSEIMETINDVETFEEHHEKSKTKWQRKRIV